MSSYTGQVIHIPLPDILDEDDMVSDSSTALATQQSIKAYVDNQYTDTIYGTGRVYMDQNRWRGFHTSYGPNYYQISSSYGTGALPAPNQRTVGAYLIGKDQVLTSIKMHTRMSDTEAVPFEIQWGLIRAGVYTAITTFTNPGGTTNLLSHADTPNLILQDGDMMLMSGRKVGGSATRKFCYVKWTMEMTE